MSLLIIAVILLEVAAAYFFWYRNLEATTIQANGDSIVRVDLPGYRSVIKLLDTLVAFEPDNEAADLGSPFIFR